MEGDYDYMYSDAHEDLDYYEGPNDLDDDLFYDDYDGSDGGEDYYYDERDNVMNEDFDERMNMVVEPEDNDDAYNESHNGSDDNMSEVCDATENGENFEGSDDSTHDCSREVESDEGESSLEQINGTPDEAEDALLVEEDEEGDVDVDDNQSEPSGGNQSEPSGESEQDIFTDAQNDNYDDDDGPEYLHSDDYEDMVDGSDGDDDDIWDGDFIGPAPWQADDTWDDVVAMGDEWYDYYEGDEVWDEDANDGRFELRYEEYGGDTIPGNGDVREARVVDNYVTCTTAVEAGKGAQEPAPAGDRLGPEGANRLCPICLERLDAQEVGSPWNCNHYFCINCILEWVRRSNTCPVDRETICKIAVRCHVGSPVNRVVSVVPVGRVAEEA